MFEVQLPLARTSVAVVVRLDVGDVAGGEDAGAARASMSP